MLVSEYPKKERKKKTKRRTPPGGMGGRAGGDFYHIHRLNRGNIFKNCQLKNDKHKFVHCVTICDLKTLLYVTYTHKLKKQHKATLPELKGTPLSAIILNAL